MFHMVQFILYEPSDEPNEGLHAELHNMPLFLLEKMASDPPSNNRPLTRQIVEPINLLHGSVLAPADHLATS